MTAWLLVGVTLLLVAIVWRRSLTDAIVMPLIAAGIVMPLIAAVGALKRHGVPRGVAAALVRVAIVLAGALMTVVILVGITSQAPHISAQLNDAAETAARWRRDVGVDHAKAQDAQQDASEALRSIVPALLTGVAGSLKALSSLVSSSR